MSGVLTKIFRTLIPRGIFVASIPYNTILIRHAQKTTIPPFFLIYAHEYFPVHGLNPSRSNMK